jgi:low temperature requirement protein LtrA
MTKQSQRNKKGPASKKATSPGKNVLLALTLVPLVIGIILIGAWVLDLELLENPQSQVTVGIFFFLLTFTASNAIQNRWRLAAGWGLLAVADLITLAWLNLAAQIVAISAGLVGLGMLGIEFYKQYQQGKAKQASK